MDSFVGDAKTRQPNSKTTSTHQGAKKKAGTKKDLREKKSGRLPGKKGERGEERPLRKLVAACTVLGEGGMGP